MTSYGYIIMSIVYSCIIWFHLDCIMKLKLSYHIATKVCSRKSATTFGDLPDCLSGHRGQTTCIKRKYLKSPMKKLVICVKIAIVRIIC